MGLYSKKNAYKCNINNGLLFISNCFVDFDYKEKLALEKDRQRIERELRMLDEQEVTRENIRIEKKMQPVCSK